MLRSCIQTGEIKLASGRTTDFYFDGREVTLRPEGLKLVSQLAWEHLRGEFDAVGGPTSGADAMVAGIGLEALSLDYKLKTFFVRGAKKEHGMGKMVEGPAFDDKDRVALIDDVATTGGSIIRAAEALKAECGITARVALVIVDREEGAQEKLADQGIELIALFTRSELMQ